MKPKRIVKKYDIFRGVGTATDELHLVTGTCSEVSLVNDLKDHFRIISTITRGYTGKYALPISPEELHKFAGDVLETKLSTPLEMVNTVWLIEGVTRAWTHQAVRYRVGSAYVQESMRFWGLHKVYEVYVPPKIASDKEQLGRYGRATQEGIQAYVNMKQAGADDQDARGVLPTNVLTKMFVSWNLSTLHNIFQTRWCCQAQTSEWMPILIQMKKALVPYRLDRFLSAPIDRGEPCGFNASFDRPCVWKNRDLEEIEANLPT